jgi:hypothetical protein
MRYRYGVHIKLRKLRKVECLLTESLGSKGYSNLEDVPLAATATKSHITIHKRHCHFILGNKNFNLNLRTKE